jgi:hypothetical protein
MSRNLSSLFIGSFYSLDMTIISLTVIPRAQPINEIMYLDARDLLFLMN